jgi:hypothetical protein
MIWKILSTIIFCLGIIFPNCAFSESPHTAKSVLVVLVNAYSLEDLRTAENLPGGGWVQRAAIGAMNLRTAGSKNDVNNLITISSGNRALGIESAIKAYLSTDRIDWFRQVTGTNMKPGEIVVPSLVGIVEKNEEQPYSVLPGLLGQVLHDHHLSTAVWGNSDLGRHHIRQFAPLLAMDQRGIVDQGDISAHSLLHESNHAYGMMSDYRFLLNQIHQPKLPALTVVELGDLYRLHSLESSIWSDHFSKMKTNVLKEINQFMNDLVRIQKADQLILFVSPMVNRDAVNAKSLMAPIAVIYPNKKGGTLSSSTTKRIGVIGNIDVAPTILSWLELSQPAQMIGRPAHAYPTYQEKFWEDFEKIKFIYATRPKILGVFITFQMVTFLFSAILWLCDSFYVNRQPLKKTMKAAQFLLLFNLVLPFLFLVLPILPYQKGLGKTALLLLILGIAVTASIRKLSAKGKLLVVSFLCWLPVLLDGIFNQFRYMERSYLGYDPIIGARYYGVGNEYEGVIIGSSILTIVMIAELKSASSVLWKWGITGICVINLIYFALPQWGTDAGGAISAAIAYTVVLIPLFQIPMTKEILWKAGAVLFGAFLLFLYVNVMGADSSQSHIGRAFEGIFAGDWQEIGHIIHRKWQMNIRLIRSSLWGKVFFFSLLTLLFLWSKRPARMKQLGNYYPFVAYGFFGIGIGAFAALVLNDSGIVAGATTLLYGVGPLLYLGLQPISEWEK